MVINVVLFLLRFPSFVHSSQLIRFIVNVPRSTVPLSFAPLFLRSFFSSYFHYFLLSVFSFHRSSGPRSFDLFNFFEPSSFYFGLNEVFSTSPAPLALNLFIVKTVEKNATYLIHRNPEKSAHQ